MKIKCDWCGSWMNDFDQTCPNCGGVNQNYKRQADGTPRTIEELKVWAKEKNLPLAEMRTFIGEDYKGAKAFGIYKDEAAGTFVVYKNKADGTRAIRYQGTDEAYAVNELYQKMKERVAEQKNAAGGSGAGSNGTKSTGQRVNAGQNIDEWRSKRRKRLGIFLVAQLLILFVIPAIFILSSVDMITGVSGLAAETGYYTYEGDSYYNYFGDWYIWNNGGWTETPVSDWMEDENSFDYYDSYIYEDNTEYEDFTDSPYYEEPSYSSDDSWDDDDWDSGWDSNDSWDSGYDDWDSDW